MCVSRGARFFQMNIFVYSGVDGSSSLVGPDTCGLQRNAVHLDRCNFKQDSTAK